MHQLPNSQNFLREFQLLFAYSWCLRLNHALRQPISYEICQQFCVNQPRHLKIKVITFCRRSEILLGPCHDFSTEGPPRRLDGGRRRVRRSPTSLETQVLARKLRVVRSISLGAIHKIFTSLRPRPRLI